MIWCDEVRVYLSEICLVGLFSWGTSWVGGVAVVDFGAVLWVVSDERAGVLGEGQRHER